MYKVNKKAFTLVEILITLAVMSVLLIVLISNVDSATDKARKTASLTDIRSLQYAVLQVANQDKELTNDLNALADLLNKNLDTELTVVVENNKLKTSSTDAWGNPYQLRYSRPANTNGQIQILSAGSDGKFETQDDIITGIICQQLGSGTNVVVKDTVNLDEVIPDNLDPSTQTGHTCIFDQVVQTEQYLQTPGNCAIPAMYYYSCTCGNSGHTTFSGLKDLNVHIANQTYKYESVNNTEHVKIYMCSECQTILNTVVEEHNFKDDDCTKCNYDPHTHVYTEQIMSNEYQKSPATCTSPAVYYYICTCGAKGTQTYTHGDKLEHEYIQTISKYPSCTQKGTYLYTCNGCNNSYTEDIAMYAHSYVKENTSNQYLQTDATCKYPAKYFYTCECGDIGTNTFEYGDVNKNNHAYTTGLDYEIFDNEEHYIKTVCNGCNATLNSTKGNHVLNEQNTCKLCNSHSHVFDQQNNNHIKDNATCTTKATYFYECVCGEPGTEYYEFGEPNPSNHTGPIVNVGTKDVHSQYSCCKTTSSSEHEYVISVEKAATCTEKGINKYTCACGYVYTDQNIDMIAHKYVENVVSTYLKSQATCTSKAIYYKTCICGKQNGETFEYGEMLSHTPTNGGTSAIHTKCNVCNTTISSTHNYNSQIITNATCQTVGKQQKICACGYSYYEEIAKTSHIDADNNMFCDNCNIRTGYAAYTLVFQSNGNASYYGSTNKVTRTFTGWMNTEYSSSSKTPWYSYRNTIKEIIIEDGVNPTSTKYWFTSFSALETLIIGNNMTTISSSICSNSSLKNLTIGQGVTTIESSAFYGCVDLISINFNATEITNEIAGNTFYKAGREGNGVTVTIGKNVTKIPNNMFSYGNSLSSANNINIKTLTFEEGSQCTYIGDLAFAYNEKMTSAILPNNITYIGKKAFDGCSSLKQIVIPECVEFIGEDAFADSKNVTSIQYNAINCADLELMNGVFDCAGRSSSGISVTIGENVKVVPAYLFKPYNSTDTSPKIISVQFMGNKVTHINSNAFAYLIDLQDISLPTSLQHIDSAAFYLDKKITQITIPQNVSYIGSSAFGSCYNVSSIVFDAKSTNDIESNWGMPFGACGSDHGGFTLTIGENVEEIGAYMFRSGVITSCSINSTKLKKIGDYAFSGQTAIESLSCNNLTYLGNYAFSGCTSLHTFDMTNAPIQTIGSYAFNGCTSLKNFVMPSKIVKIGTYAFQNCSSITTIHIPKTTTFIGSYAFYGCTSLASVTFEKTSCWRYGSSTQLKLEDAANNASLLSTSYRYMDWTRVLTGLDLYTWDELKTIAQLNLTAAEYKSRYGIELGQIKDDKYILVDLDGNGYDGFVFMYDTGDNGGINGDVNSNATNKGGYAKSEVAKVVDKFYTSLTDLELKQAIKPVTIICNNGSSSYSTQYEYDCYMFIASHREVGGTNHTDDQYATYIDAEGQRFDYLTSNANRKKIVNGENYFWWTRTAMPNSNSNFYSVAGGGTHTNNVSRSPGSIVATFVIG